MSWACPNRAVWLVPLSILFLLLQVGLVQRQFVDILVLQTIAATSSIAAPLEDTGVRIWTQITISLEYEQHLLPHLLDHYIQKLAVDPKFILLSLHHRNENSTQVLDATEKEVGKKYGVRHFHRWFGDYDSNRLWEERQSHRDKVGVQPCDWIVKGDADELPAFPGNNLKGFLSSVETQGFDAIFGRFLDRVSRDGSLVDISSAPSLSEQFPMSCDITSAIAQGDTLKAVAFRGYHKENRGGHHLLETSRQDYEFRKQEGQDHCAYPKILRIDHYKWTSQVLQKVLVRSNHYKKLGMGHYIQSSRLLDHIIENSGLNVTTLNCTTAHLDDSIFWDDEEYTYNDGMSCNRSNHDLLCSHRS